MGYNKVTLNRGYNMLAVQFNEVGGNAQSIQDVFTGNLPDMAYDESTDTLTWNANLLTWTGAGYMTYYWTGSIGGELFGDESYNNVWVVGEYGEGGIADASTPIGNGCFLWTSGNGVNVQQAGEVGANATGTVSLSAGYNLVGNPFPEAVNIQDISFANLPDMEYDESTDTLTWNANLLTWTGAGYNTYYWTGSIGGDLFGDENYKNVWVVGEYGEGGIADVDINIGDAFFVWLRSGANVTATFTK